LEDRESYAFNMELMLRNEMDATDDAKYQLKEKDEKIEQLENTIQKLKEKNKSLEATNDKLAFKIEDQAIQIAGLQGQCAYLNQYLMKFDSWPTKNKALLAAKESTPEAPKNDPKEQVVSKAKEEETPMEKNSEEHIGTRVKRRRTGNTKAYLTQFK
jgi:predicted RNase H-like nuclease (RuvC/YqgF family)